MSDQKTGISRRQFLEKTLSASAAAAAASVFPLTVSGCSDSSLPFDTVIKQATVFDGIHPDPVVADIGIKGDRIAFIGAIDLPAGQVIHAKGLAVVPGFIDVHTHCDLTFIKTGWKRHLAAFMPSWKGNYNYLGQGVTTVVTGNCGWGYGSIDQWYDITRQVGFGTNVCHLAPHGVIREELFGENQPKELSRAQMDRFKKRIQEELDKGAIGLSTGLEYAPGLLAPTSELIELCEVVAQYGRIYATHIRDESGAVDPETGLPGVRKAIEEAIEVGRRAGVGVEISHLKIDAPVSGHDAALVLAPIERARAEGLAITADQYPYAAGSTIISILLPDALRSPGGVRDEFRTREGLGQVRKEIEKVFRYLPPDKILITMCPENEGFEGKTLEQIAGLENKSPAETYAGLVSAPAAPVGVFFGQDMAVVRGIMANDYILTGSDGWTVPKGMTKPHPRTYGTFARKLGTYWREEKLVDLFTCLRSMTALPAQTFGIKDRGRIETGCFADLAVIDLDRVGDKATYLSPHQYASGIVHLMVNGEVSIRNGVFTGDRGGRNLRA